MATRKGSYKAGPMNRTVVPGSDKPAMKTVSQRRRLILDSNALPEGATSPGDPSNTVDISTGPGYAPPGDFGLTTYFTSNSIEAVNGVLGGFRNAFACDAQSLIAWNAGGKYFSEYLFDGYGGGLGIPRTSVSSYVWWYGYGCPDVTVPGTACTINGLPGGDVYLGVRTGHYGTSTNHQAEPNFPGGASSTTVLDSGWQYDSSNTSTWTYTVGVAYDLDNMRMFICFNGVWQTGLSNAGGDPNLFTSLGSPNSGWAIDGGSGNEGVFLTSLGFYTALEGDYHKQTVIHPVTPCTYGPTGDPYILVGDNDWAGV